VTDETWIDANVFAVPRLIDDLDQEPRAIAEDWVRERLGLEDPATVEAIVAVLEASPEMVRQAFYIGPFARQKADAWHPAADWIQDDLLDAGSAWRMVQRIPEPELDDAINEKEAAVRLIADARHRLQQLLSARGHPKLEKLFNSLMYTESFFETLRDLLAGLVAYRRYLKSKAPDDAGLVRQKLLQAQSHWSHHTQRHSNSLGTPTAFRENQFWDLTQDMLSQVS
jgi:hypothetical protein